MKLPFEKWLEAHQPDAHAQAAFAEGLLAYRAGAHRASLLFSYLGWGRTLRQRLLGATCPAGIPPGQWTSIQNRLRNQDTWDDQVFKCTQQQNPAPVFLVQPDIRQQVLYWKDRRNDCAHYKENPITQAHVESFWSFIQANMPHFVPNGSMEALLHAIEVHYDPNLTPPGQPVAGLAARVPAEVQPADLPNFFAELDARLVNILGTPRTQEISEVLREVLLLGDGSAQACANHLLSNDNFLLAVLRLAPSCVLRISPPPSAVRRIWRELLFDGGGPDLPVLACMLRNDLIPAVQVEEAVQRSVRNSQGEIPTAQDLPVLTTAGWTREVREYAFVGSAINSFGWANRNAQLAAWYVKNYTVDDDIGRRLIQTFESAPYPFGAQASLQTMFQQDEEKLAELVAVAARLGETVPATLQ